MRSMWKGAVSFGLVMIPVKLYAATEQKDIAFRQVHREDGGRIRFRRFCSIEDIEVPYEDIAKGYELPGGEVVVLTEEDMADLPLPTTRNIEVVQFCPAEQVDPIMFNRSYYAEPETAGARAYVLLRDAMEQSGKVAIAKVALRQRESLAVLRVREGVLVLETLLWPDEVRETEFPFLDDDIEVRPQELRMAGSLIDSMTVDFDPDEYHDDYREALQEVVNAKIEGREILQPEPGAEVASQPSSLADALRASLAAAKGGKLSIAGASDEHAGGEEDESEEEAEQPTRRRAAKSGTASKTAAKPKAAAKPKTTGASKTAARSKPAAKEPEPEPAARPRKRAG
ncbi:MAG TPA: Ku protein [Streptosporangiaceae bacterium]|nr:Ku protein [Streptosporangiaceae bacterium]